MKQVKKIMFVMIVSLSTMSLFSFKNANTNEQAFKNVRVTSYGTLNSIDPGDPVQFTGAIIRTFKKILTSNSKEILVRVLTSIILVPDQQPASINARSQSILLRIRRFANHRFTRMHRDPISLFKYNFISKKIIG